MTPNQARLDEVEVLTQLPSLRPFLVKLASHLNSTCSPGSLFIHAPSNPSLVLPLILHVLESRRFYSNGNDDPPTIEQLLPKVAVVDLEEVHSTRQAFDRALNEFSAWAGEGGGMWDEREGSVMNWDGRTEGLRVVRRAMKRKSAPVGGAQGGKRKKRARKDFEEEGDDELVVEDSLEEEPAEQEHSFQWALEWDRTIPPTRESMAPIPDTIESFHTSLSTILSLSPPVAPFIRSRRSCADSPDSADEEERDDVRDLPVPRYIIFDHAEMLSDLAAAGNVGGAPKETGMGMTFANSIRRIGQLVRRASS
jgi:hypothetical protein